MDDEDTKQLIKEKTSGDTVIQEIVIPAFDIHHTKIGSGNGEERITTTVYEIYTSPTHAAKIKSTLYKVSYPKSHPFIQFTPYGIQGITNKDIYKIFIKKANVLVKDNSIISIHDVEEGDIRKFSKRIENTKYVQIMELVNESQTKGKYFIITTKPYYKNAVKDVNTMIK